jgi:hypothetical protein
MVPSTARPSPSNIAPAFRVMMAENSHALDSMSSTAPSSPESTRSTLSSPASASAAVENQLIEPNISPPATPRRVVPASLLTSLPTLTQNSVSPHAQSTEPPDQLQYTSSDRDVETAKVAINEPESVIYGGAAAVEVCLFYTSQFCRAHAVPDADHAPSKRAIPLDQRAGVSCVHACERYVLCSAQT